MARVSAAKSSKNQAVAAKVRAATIGAGEPIITKENYSVDLIRAFTYYRTYEDDKNFRKWIQKFIGKDADKLKKLSDTRDEELVTLAVLIRLQEREQYLEERDSDRINTKLATILNRPNPKEKEDVKSKKISVVLSVAEKIEALSSGHIGTIEGEIDSFILGGYKSEFDTKGFIETNNISAPVAKLIGKWFTKQLAEFNEALTSKEEQMVEAYSFMSKPKMKKLIAFVEGIVAECVQRKVAVVRAPRKVKVKPAAEIVKSMKFLKDFPELKLEGQHPAKLIGATEAWLYDTRYKKLVVYKALDSAGLSVKGSSIVGFDTSSSEIRTLRKPEEWFKIKSAKRELSAAWKKLTTKVAIPTGRVNENLIIVAIL